MQIMSTAVTASERHLKDKVTPILQQTFFEAGHATAKVLSHWSQTTIKSIRVVPRPKVAASVINFKFDEINQDAADWARAHAGELIDGISETTRDAIKEFLADAFEGDEPMDELQSKIEDLLGDEDRADLIADTETMDAANSGQREAWDQAVDEGLLTGDEQRVWITTDDDALCDDCDSMDGETADMDGEYSNGAGDGPPLHPLCRCTEGIELPKIEGA